MRVISSEKFILFALATVVFLTSHSMCLDELIKSSLESREDNDDKYYEVRSVCTTMILFGGTVGQILSTFNFLEKALLTSFHSIQHYSTSSMKKAC